MEQKNNTVISIGDLENVIKVFDYAAEQGAFKGWNVIQDVFTIRQKIFAFVEQAKADQPFESKEETE